MKTLIKKIMHFLNQEKSKFPSFGQQSSDFKKLAPFSILGKFNKNIKEVIIWDKMHGQPGQENF